MVDMMIDLQRKYGPFSGRVWGLILNVTGNALMLYGVAGMLRDGSRLFLFITGITITILCVAILAKPDKGKDKEHSAENATNISNSK